MLSTRVMYAICNISSYLTKHNQHFLPTYGFRCSIETERRCRGVGVPRASVKYNDSDVEIQNYQAHVPESKPWLDLV